MIPMQIKPQIGQAEMPAHPLALHVRLCAVRIGRRDSLRNTEI